MEPLVSVVMSVFNGEKYVTDAIDSVINQTYKNWELIIIDDGSTDSTASLIKNYQDRRIQYIFHKNMGLTKSLNKGIKLSRGEYIARIDSDDRAFPERFEKQVEYFVRNPEVVLIGSSYYKFDASTRMSSIFTPPLDDLGCRKLLKLGHSLFHHSSVMFKKQVAGEMVLYDENYREAQDVRLWITLLGKGKAAALSETLCCILSSHSGSISSNRSPLESAKFQWHFSRIARHELDGNFYDLLLSFKSILKGLLLNSLKVLFVYTKFVYTALYLYLFSLYCASKGRKGNQVDSMIVEIWQRNYLKKI